MKVIIIREQPTRVVVKSYLVNDDVSMSQGDEGRLKERGYSVEMMYPIPMDQEGLEEEIEDYCMEEEENDE